ncbi:MAG TPA: MotA/TolQ/ExbB proton channel family protein [Candidatus Limiplasma sp.]|nr:MotA/TolQ/ExbB proton channel family protein [Candidatus Limiplasma sp.]HPS80684.1 MotA/TolQ/ExbB proton channel family protein [Candidatus Limiplasma sp.]
MVNELIAQLTSGMAGAFVYGAIALVTLIGFSKCVYPVLRNSALLNRGIMKLERSAVSNERPVWREARFLGRALRPEWQRFLLNAGQLDLRGMPCNTQEYINEDTVIYKPGHAQLAELIPSLLTSLGILGTFMGLMSGLSDLDLTDAAKTIGSIPTLLNGMKFAFATSVAGISCSLLFNIINRASVGHAFKTLDSFDEAFYELAMPRPLDAEVQMICQKQDDELNLQRAADQVGSQLATAVEVAVSRAVHPLTMSLDNFIQGTTREQVEGVQRIVGQFIHQMNTTMNGQLTALADTLTILNQNQAATQQNLQRTLKVAESLVDDAKRIQQSSREFASALESDTQAVAHEKQDELIDLLRENVNQQAALTRGMGAMQNELLETLRNIEARLPVSSAEQTAAQAEALTESLGRMREAMDAVSGRVEASLPETNIKGRNRKHPSNTEGI